MRISHTETTVKTEISEQKECALPYLKARSWLHSVLIHGRHSPNAIYPTLAYLSMASWICEVGAICHSSLETCQRPVQIRGTVNGPISKVSKLAGRDDILGRD